MSMKKILMAAAAVTALTAGSAGAASIKTATISGLTVYDVTATTASTPYKLATETKLGAGLSTTATGSQNSVVLLVDAGRRTGGAAGTDYIVSFTYTGPAGFQANLDTSSLTMNNATGCTPAKILTDGGLKNAKTVTYTVTLPLACDATTGVSEFTLAAPLTISGFDDVTVTGKIMSGGSTIDNGAATARTLIKSEAGFDFSTKVDTEATNWVLAGTKPYTSLTTDKKLGEYTLKNNTADAKGPFVSMTGASTDLVSDAAVNLTADVSISGDVSSTTLTVGGTAATKDTAKKVSTRAGIAKSSDARTVIIAADADLATSQSSLTYVMTVTPQTTALGFTAPAAKTLNLQTVGLEGTNFNVPWVAGSQSPSSTVIRIANNGTADTGAVTIMMKSPNRNKDTKVGASTCTSATLESLGKIAAGGEVVLGLTELTTCFGDFKRGDLVVTVQGASDNLTAKARLTTASGQISETSIGGLKQFGAY